VAADALLLLLLFEPPTPFSFPFGRRVDVVVLLAGEAKVYVLRYEL